jgi:steroid delta-isomerase-like uncharacterized protein
MSTAQETSNKASAKRFLDAANSRDAGLIAKTIDELVAPDAVIRTPLSIAATGAELLKEVFARLLRAYPDLHITVEDLIEEDDKVVMRNTVTGTHQGEHMGVPPTGKAVTYNEIFIARFADGRIAETWGIVDVLSQLRQLGAIPAAPEQTHGGAPVPPQDNANQPAAMSDTPKPAQRSRKDPDR